MGFVDLSIWVYGASLVAFSGLPYRVFFLELKVELHKSDRVIQ